MGEQGTLEKMSSPHRIGGWGAQREEPLSGGSRVALGCKWLLLLLLNLIISLIYIIVGSPRPRPPPFSPARRYTFQQKYLQNPTKTLTLQIVFFVVVAFFLWFSCKDSHDFPLKRNVFSLFLTNMWLFPKDYHTFWKLSRHWGALCTHQCHEIVPIS